MVLFKELTLKLKGYLSNGVRGFVGYLTLLFSIGFVKDYDGTILLLRSML